MGYGKVNKIIYGKPDMNKIKKEFQKKIGKEVNVEKCMEVRKEACKKGQRKVKAGKNGEMPYWWTETIQEAVIETKQMRRQYTRARTDQQRKEKWEIYKKSKKELKRKITKSKKQNGKTCVRN